MWTWSAPNANRNAASNSDAGAVLACDLANVGAERDAPDGPWVADDAIMFELVVIGLRTNTRAGKVPLMADAGWHGQRPLLLHM